MLASQLALRSTALRRAAVHGGQFVRADARDAVEAPEHGASRLRRTRRNKGFNALCAEQKSLSESS
eukprot:6214110-Pleurochrysis_carterae.AAC.2